MQQAKRLGKHSHHSLVKLALEQLTYSIPTCLVHLRVFRQNPGKAKRFRDVALGRFRKSARVNVKRIVGTTVVTVAVRGFPVSGDISPTAAPSEVEPQGNRFRNWVLFSNFDNAGFDDIHRNARRTFSNNGFGGRIRPF
jgi:hypothetical protein